MQEDGVIVIGTDLKTAKLETKLEKLKNKHKNEELKLEAKYQEIEQARKETEILSKKLEENNKYVEEQKKLLEQVSKEYDEINRKVNSGERKDIGAISRRDFLSGEKQRIQDIINFNSREVDSGITKQYDEAIEKVIKLENEASKQENTIKDINNELELTNFQIDKIKNKEEEISEEDTRNIKNSIDSIGNGIERVTKKVVKWGLAVFGIRSIYSFIRSSMGTLSGYDDKIAADVDYIRFALATSMKPLIEWIIKGVYEILKGINYLSMAWFNYNLFQNASVSNFKKMNKSAKELQKTMSSFDEMNVVSDNSDKSSGFTAPSQDLSKGLNMEGYEAPGWLKWIADHGEDIAKIAGLIIGSSVIGKLAGLAGIAKLGAIIGASVIGISLIYTGLTGRDIIEDLKTIKKEMPELTQATDDSVNRQKSVSNSTRDTTKSLKEQSEAVGKNSKETAKYNTYLKETIKDSASSIALNSKNIGKVNLLGKGILALTGGLDDYNKQQDNFKEGAKVNYRLLQDTLGEYQTLYKQGLLNEEETKDYAETMYLFGYELDGTKMKSEKYALILKGLGFKEKEITQIVAGTSKGYELLSEKMRTVTDRTEKISDKKDKLKDITGKLNEKLQLEIDKIDEEIREGGKSKDEIEKLKKKKELLKTATENLTRETGKEADKYDDLKKAIKTAYDEGLLSADEAIGEINKLISGMSDEAKTAFTEDLPDDIKNGLNTSKYNSEMNTFTKWWNNNLDTLKKEITIHWSAEGGGNGSFGGDKNYGGGGGFRAKGGIFYPSKIPKLAVGGIVNMPGRGVPYNGAIIGERGAEAVVPLTDSQQMALLGEAIGKYITINATLYNYMNGRVISREIQRVQNENDFAYNR